jgi:hypothetical protein
LLIFILRCSKCWSLLCNAGRPYAWRDSWMASICESSFSHCQGKYVSFCMLVVIFTPKKKVLLLLLWTTHKARSFEIEYLIHLHWGDDTARLWAVWSETHLYWRYKDACLGTNRLLIFSRYHYYDECACTCSHFLIPIRYLLLCTMSNKHTLGVLSPICLWLCILLPIFSRWKFWTSC